MTRKFVVGDREIYDSRDIAEHFNNFFTNVAKNLAGKTGVYIVRVMNMRTHNARGKDLRSFSETGRECISPNSWLPSYGGTPTQAMGLPRGKFEKKVANCGI